MLEEIKVIDKIEVIEDGTVLVRQATRIVKDGVQIAHSFHRWSFIPGSDISAMPPNVQAIAGAAWAALSQTVNS